MNLNVRFSQIAFDAFKLIFLLNMAYERNSLLSFSTWMYPQWDKLKRIWELSFGNARGREANLDLLNMAPVACDKKRPRPANSSFILHLL